MYLMYDYECVLYGVFSYIYVNCFYFHTFPLFFVMAPVRSCSPSLGPASHCCARERMLPYIYVTLWSWLLETPLRVLVAPWPDAVL